MNHDEMLNIFTSMKTMRDGYDIEENPFMKKPIDNLDGEKISPKVGEFINRITSQVNLLNQALKKRQAQMSHLEKEYRNLKVANVSLQSKVDELKDIIDNTETA